MQGAPPQALARALRRVAAVGRVGHCVRKSYGARLRCSDTDTAAMSLTSPANLTSCFRGHGWWCSATVTSGTVGISPRDELGFGQVPTRTTGSPRLGAIENATSNR